MARPPIPLGSGVRVTLLPVGMGTGTPEEGGGLLDGGLAVANRFTAEVDDPELGYTVRLTLGAHDRRLAPETVEVVMRPGGSPVTATGLRAVKVDAYVALIRAELGNRGGGFAVMRRQEGGGWTQWSGVPEKDWPRFERSQARRRRPEDTLPEVAAAYREALGHRNSAVVRAPTQYVANTLHYSRGHAARLVSQARRAGLLGQAHPGRAGEITPTPTEEGKP